MTAPKTDRLRDATNRQAPIILPSPGAPGAGYLVSIERAVKVSRDPARRLAIARRIARETRIASAPGHVRQTRLH
jgi:hypothetical protein